jgi:hypothetical protein
VVELDLVCLIGVGLGDPTLVVSVDVLVEETGCCQRE